MGEDEEVVRPSRTVEKLPAITRRIARIASGEYRVVAPEPQRWSRGRVRSGNDMADPEGDGRAGSMGGKSEVAAMRRTERGAMMTRTMDRGGE